MLPRSVYCPSTIASRVLPFRLSAIVAYQPLRNNTQSPFFNSFVFILVVYLHLQLHYILNINLE